jgi:hypothetical protein
MKEVELVELDEWMQTSETEFSKLLKQEIKKMQKGEINSVDFLELKRQAKLNIEKKKIKAITKQFIEITKNSL